MLKTDDNPEGTPQSVFDGVAKGIGEDRAHFFPQFFGVGLISKPVSDEVLAMTTATALTFTGPETRRCRSMQRDARPQKGDKAFESDSASDRRLCKSRSRLRSVLPSRLRRLLGS